MDNQTEAKPAAAHRLVNIDILRGMLLVFVSWVHMGYFVGALSLGEIFWIGITEKIPKMHFLPWLIGEQLSPPGFFLLMGFSMVLFAESRKKKGWRQKDIIRNFMKRGGILIFIQFILNPIWLLSPMEKLSRIPGTQQMILVFLGIFFSLGILMILAAFTLELGTLALSLITIASFLVPTIYIPRPEFASYAFSYLLRILLIPGQTGYMKVTFTIFPWLGFVLLGILFGRLFLRIQERIFRLSLVFSSAGLFLFLLVRLYNGFGNIAPFNRHDLFSFFYLCKYPADITYALASMSFIFFMLYISTKYQAAFEKRFSFLIVFGQNSMFFYTLHYYLYGFFGYLCMLLLGRGRAGCILMYIIWVIGLIILYHLCRAFKKFKSGQPENSWWKLI